MNKHLIYVIVAITGFMLAYNIDLKSPIQEVKAAQPEVLPVEFSNKFKMDLDLQTGHAHIESNHPFTKSDINVYNPTDTVFSTDTILIPNPIKVKEIAYETKVIVLEKYLPLSIPVPSLKKPQATRIDKFER